MVLTPTFGVSTKSNFRYMKMLLFEYSKQSYYISMNMHSFCAFNACTTWFDSKDYTQQKHSAVRRSNAIKRYRDHTILVWEFELFKKKPNSSGLEMIVGVYTKSTELFKYHFDAIEVKLSLNFKFIVSSHTKLFLSVETKRMGNISECKSNMTSILRVTSRVLFFQYHSIGVCFSFINVHKKVRHWGKFDKIFFISLHSHYFLFSVMIKIVKCLCGTRI